MADLSDVSTGDLITAARQNDINDYIQDGTHKVNTLSLDLGGTEVISNARLISGAYDSKFSNADSSIEFKEYTIGDVGGIGFELEAPVLKGTPSAILGSGVGVADFLFVTDIDNDDVTELSFVKQDLSNTISIYGELVNNYFAINADWNPVTDETHNLGSASLEWKDLFVNGVGYIDSIVIEEAGNIGCDTDTDLLQLNNTYMEIAGQFYPKTDGAFTLGATNSVWAELWANAINSDGTITITPANQYHLAISTTFGDAVGITGIQAGVQPSATFTHDYTGLVTQMNNVVRADLERTGTINGYSGGTIERNVSWYYNLNNDATYSSASGSTNITVEDYGHYGDCYSRPTFDSAGNTMTHRAVAMCGFVENDVVETAGTLNTENIAFWAKIDSFDANVTNGTCTNYGLYIDTFLVFGSETNWGVYDASGYDWKLTSLDQYIQFNDSGTKIGSDDDGHLDLFADTRIDLSGATVIGDGGTTNYSEFEADGTLEFNGTATVWKDINLGAAQLSRPSSSQPDLVNFLDEAGADTGIQTYGFAVGEKIHGSFEMQHDYKEGSDITFHVHWQGITAPSGTDNVQWRLTYSFAEDDATLDAVTIIDSADTAFDTQYEFKRTDIVVITGTDITIGQQMIFTLERVAATGDAYLGDALIATAGIHYEVDTVGSRNIITK